MADDSNTTLEVGDSVTSSSSGASVGATSSADTTARETSDSTGTGAPTCDADEFAETVCEGDVADVSNALWDDTTLIRPPKGAGDFTESTTFFAVLQPEPAEFASCVEGCPRALIEFGAIGNADDVVTPLPMQATALAENLGYPESMIFSDEIDRGDAYWAVIDVPVGGDEPPSRSRLHMAIWNEAVYWVLYRCHPDAWNALKETFLLSAESLIVLPR